MKLPSARTNFRYTTSALKVSNVHVEEQCFVIGDLTFNFLYLYSLILLLLTCTLHTDVSLIVRSDITSVDIHLKLHG